MNCQAAYLIRVLKGLANLTEDQALRCGRYLELNTLELDYFLDLVRLDRAADSETKKYLNRILEKKAVAAREIKNRITSSPLETSIENQVWYYTRWEPSVLHVATSCPRLQTTQALSKHFELSLEKVKEILERLAEIGLVHQQSAHHYVHSGKSVHLDPASPLHPVFQKMRREIGIRRLDHALIESDLRYSSVFATSRKHRMAIREGLLTLIEGLHEELKTTDSEEVSLMVLDFHALTDIPDRSR